MMARGQRPLTRTQARALRALGADTPPPAASPETSVFDMAPPSASTGVGEVSSSRPSLAGAAEVSAPSSPPTASTGDTSGAGSDSWCQLGGFPASRLGFQLRGPSDGTRSAANAPEASFVAPGAPRYSSARWEDIEDIVTAGTDRTVRQVQGSTQSQVLALARLAIGLNHQPPLRTDYELDQRLEAPGSLSDLRSVVRLTSGLKQTACATKLRTSAALPSRTFDASGLIMPMLPGSLWRLALEQSSQAAAALEQRCCRLDKSLADTHKDIRHDREQFKASISSYAAQLHQLREYLEQSDRQSSASGGASSAPASAIPVAFATFLEELGALLLAIPPPPAASGSSDGSGPTPPASSGSLGGAAAKSESSTSLTVDSDNSDDSGPIIHKGKGKRPAKSSAKLRSAPPTPKKKQRLGRPSVYLKAWKAAKKAASAVVSSNVPSQSVPSSLPAVPVLTSSALISGIVVSADSDVMSFASIPSGSDPPFSPIPRTPASPASSTASTASLPSTPVVSRGITPGTEASVPVEIDDDRGFGADGAASEASVATGGVFPSPVVFQPRRDGQPTRVASTTAELRSVVAAENEAAPDALVLGFPTPSRVPAATQASVTSSASLPDLANPLLEHVFTAAGAQEAWCEILNARIPQPIASDRVTECSIAGIQASTNWEDPLHPWQRLRARLPDSPCTFGADDFMPDKPISIRASGLAIVVKLWRQFTGRAVGRTEHWNLGFALWERAH
ncbi:unnamed protein product [Phytophthora fragariaefolia]|uniref:Unnamed protein product n=1 Tax=Phytophthora fragariaefolia TaxID=1490495 RepID=A0A9W6Y5J6_9STRA|nr:unnamed protein product [Phytophthora fragariaefolia]